MFHWTFHCWCTYLHFTLYNITYVAYVFVSSCLPSQIICSGHEIGSQDYLIEGVKVCINFSCAFSPRHGESLWGCPGFVVVCTTGGRRMSWPTWQSSWSELMLSAYKLVLLLLEIQSFSIYEGLNLYSEVVLDLLVFCCCCWLNWSWCCCWCCYFLGLFVSVCWFLLFWIVTGPSQLDVIRMVAPGDVRFSSWLLFVWRGNNPVL